MVTANGTPLAGGQKECSLGLIANGFQAETQACRLLELPTICMEANINVDLILSFQWFVERNIDILPARYGLMVHSQPSYFIPGASVDPCVSTVSSDSIRVVHVNKIDISTLPQGPIIKEVHPQALDGVQWDSQFCECQCPDLKDLAPIVLPFHSEKLTLDQWNVFFPPIVTQNEGPAWSEEEFFGNSALEKNAS